MVLLLAVDWQCDQCLEIHLNQCKFLQLEHDSVARFGRNVSGVKEQFVRATNNHGDHIPLEGSRCGRWAIRVRAVNGGPSR